VAYQTLALVGAVGGAGTTRTAVEFGATLARDGRDVAILDAAYATQGLADYLAGRIETDITRVATVPGRLAPARSPLPGGRETGLGLGQRPHRRFAVALSAPRGRDPLPQPLDARLGLGHPFPDARALGNPARRGLGECGPQ
jgi:Mrp family chromosome partitioning ATPase